MQLEAALLNLAVNARDAMPNGGTLRVATDNLRIADARDGGSNFVSRPPDIVPGDYVVIAVADNGSGMSEDVRNHAFEPFFTTKDVGQGSGLGLSQVFGFVKYSGGYLSLDSAPGCGTRFGIFLPRSHEQPVKAVSASASHEEAPRGTGTILVVEDNDMVLEYAITLISELGYRVLHATTGRDALALIERGEPVDLLFTDVVMPQGMSGIELAREVQRRRPEIKILVTSGYAGRAALDGGGEFMSIAKPYRSTELAKRLHEALAH